MRKIAKFLLIVSLVLSNILTVNVISADGANVATYSMEEASAISGETPYALSGEKLIGITLVQKMDILMMIF